MQSASYKNNASISYSNGPLLYTMYRVTLGNAAASFNCFNYSWNKHYIILPKHVIEHLIDICDQILRKAAFHAHKIKTHFSPSNDSCTH